MVDNFYEWGHNYIQDILMHILLSDDDLMNQDVINNIHEIIVDYLIINGVSEEDSEFLDFYIENRGVEFKIKVGNIVTGMWLSEFFPDNPNLIVEKSRVIFNGKIFTYNKKTKEFSWKKKEKL